MQEMLSLREAMNQLLEESFVAPAGGRSGQGFIPAMDVSETEDSFVVELAAPGLKPEQLEITLENSVLTIKGEIQQEQSDAKRHYHRVERRYGSFTRTLTLPASVKPDAIQARLEHGILHLDIPKAEEVKPRKITVNVNRELEVNK
jgi:HSP20 family protein